MKNILIIGALFLLSSFASKMAYNPTPYEISEAINTLEDMEEWIKWDIYQGKIDSIQGSVYLENVNYAMNHLKSRN